MNWYFIKNISVILGLVFLSATFTYLGTHKVFHKKLDSLQLCENYCNSSREDFSQVREMSYGTCICDNKEGQNIAEGVDEFRNNKCEGRRK